MAITVGWAALGFTLNEGYASASTQVKLHTDSEYLQKSISLGWANRWRAKNWKKGDGKRLNWDLWERLLDLCAQHDV